MTPLGFVRRHWQLVVGAFAVLVVVAGIRWAWPRWELHALTAPAKERSARTIEDIDRLLEKDKAQTHAIEQLARQAHELERQAAEARGRRDAAEAEAGRARTTSLRLHEQLARLEAERRAQPKITTRQAARDAIAEALR